MPTLLEKVEKRVNNAKEKAEKEAEDRSECKDYFYLKTLINNAGDNDRRLEKERLEAEQRAAREAEQERLRLLAADKKGKGKGKGAPAPGPAPAPGGKVEIDSVSLIHSDYLFIEGCQVTSGGPAGKWKVNQVLKVRSGEARVESRVIPGEERLCEDDT